MADHLHIETFCLGEWMTNCYVVHPTGPSDDGAPDAPPQPCWIVDAGFNPGPMIEYIRSHYLNPVQVVLTHGHVDHIAGLTELRAVWPKLPILIHSLEERFLIKPVKNLSALMPQPIVAPEATDLIEHGQTLDLKNIPFEIRHTPGHSPGGITLYQPRAGVALVGDALFAEGIGRADFPTSDPALLERSIREQLYTLPDQTRVLPGHGPETTIGHERMNNPFVRG